MSSTLRHFQNTDTAHLMRIWNLHFEACRASVGIHHGVFDACVMSKPFFRAEDVLLYEDDSGPVGFIHVGYGSTDKGDEVDPQRPLICALCVVPHPHEDRIANELLTHVMHRIEATGAPNIMAIGAPNRYAFYIGMAPGDGLMGVVARDSRLQRWLGCQGFEAIRPTECWEVDLAQFRPPMDRSQLALRRSTSVVRGLDEQHGSWWDAVVLGHTEQIRFQLLSRDDAAVSDTVQFWFIDTTFAGIASNTVRLWMSDYPQDSEGRDRITYLLAEAFRQLQSERFSTVRAIATPEQPGSVAIFQRLGFRSVEPGLIFERRWT